MVQTLDCRVALVAFEAFRALVPADALGERLAVFWRVFENLGGPPEVAHVVRVDAALAVVAVFLGWTPRGLVEEHVKHESVLIQIERLEVVVQEDATQQAFRNEIILDRLVLEVQVDFADRLEVPQPETRHLVGLARGVEGDDEGPVKAIMAK